jgi:hypothetical protein
VGIEAVAIDASQQMVEAARVFTGYPIVHMRFQEIEWADEFDGVWACASLLHREDWLRRNPHLGGIRSHPRFQQVLDSVAYRRKQRSYARPQNRTLEEETLCRSANSEKATWKFQPSASAAWE